MIYAFERVWNTYEYEPICIPMRAAHINKPYYIHCICSRRWKKLDHHCPLPSDRDLGREDPNRWNPLKRPCFRQSAAKHFNHPTRTSSLLRNS